MIQHVIRLQFLFTICFIMFFGACNSGKHPAETTSTSTSKTPSEIGTNQKKPSIENTKWIITTLGSSDMSDREKNGQMIYFTLDSATNQINGNSGCNTFMGTYELLGDNRIIFSKLASTRKLCPDSKINESQILSVFETADNYTIMNGVLALNKSKRAPLATFKKDDESKKPVVETYWKLKTLNGKQVEMAKHQEGEIFMILKLKDNRITGFAGCNTFNGVYALDYNSRISFQKIITTMKVCPNIETNESEFLKMLYQVDNYLVNDDKLSLMIGKRTPLATFEAVYMD
ncbi:MAG: META domain-containing protein [Psychroserpens sp.]|uniref:META domain-containing protein n=1 Tax=Psychroserpens sp. TaxID=2020870 RepID=UPI003C87CA2A